MSLTDKQLETLRYVAVHVMAGHPPTLREMSVEFGIGVMPTRDRINQLIRKGYLIRKPGARGLRLNWKRLAVDSDGEIWERIPL